MENHMCVVDALRSTSVMGNHMCIVMPHMLYVHSHALHLKTENDLRQQPVSQQAPPLQTQHGTKHTTRVPQPWKEALVQSLSLGFMLL